MYCPRLDHFVRFNPDGTLSRCGHMVEPKKFTSLDNLENSLWLKSIKDNFNLEQWPNECVRCAQTEAIKGTSIRLNSIEFHKKQNLPNYLVVGGILDNICNSACQFCNENLSTKIGGLKSKNYVLINNSDNFKLLPQERIVHLDINGGEPSTSKNYKQLLNNLPPNIKSIRVNTNCSFVIEELDGLIDRGIEVTVTVSFDGIDKVHDYVRWPILWDTFHKNLMIYKTKKINLNLWTTINTLNICDLDNIFEFAQKNNIDHSWALLVQPSELDITMRNTITEKLKLKLENSPFDDIKNISKVVATAANNNSTLWSYIAEQDSLRKIRYSDYYQIESL